MDIGNRPDDEIRPDIRDRHRSVKSVPWLSGLAAAPRSIFVCTGLLLFVLLMIGIFVCTDENSSSKGRSESRKPSSTTTEKNEKVPEIPGHSLVGSRESLSVSSSTQPQGILREQANNLHEQSGVPKRLELHAPTIAPLPTQAPITPPSHERKRVELPGDLGSALINKHFSSDSFSESYTGMSNKYTLQLNGSSHPDRLLAWAKKQGLKDYHVYKTQRDGEPWYVLLTGSYATAADAKRAVVLLSKEIQAMGPWIKSVDRLKKESENDSKGTTLTHGTKR